MANLRFYKKSGRSSYLTRFEIGAILALSFLIIAFQSSWEPNKKLQFQAKPEEIVPVLKVDVTVQNKIKPPPIRPRTPVVVPENEFLDDGVINLDPIFNQIGKPALPPDPVKQVTDAIEDIVFIRVEEMPKPIGGLKGIMRKIRYPELAKKAGISGTVTIQFVVDKKGNAVDPFVLRGIGGGCDQEAMRAILATKFTPGRQRTKFVRVKMSIPIRFKLK